MTKIKKILNYKMHNDMVDQTENDPGLVQRINFCQWSQVDSNLYIASGATFKTLPAGKYVAKWYKSSHALEFRPLEIDEIYVFPNSIPESVLKEAQEFWDNEDKYKTHNLLHRRGLLLYGAQGHGKTSIIQLIMQDVIQRNGIVLVCNTDPELVDQIMQNFRQVEPTRKLLCVFEDIDALIETWGEDHILSILDGENQINHVLNVATSNYPENLDNRLTNRPRRFDNIVKVEAINRIERELYFSKKITFTSEEEKQKWLDVSEGFSFAALAEMVISIKILDRDFDDTVNRLKMMMKNKSIRKEKSELGF